MSAILIPLAAVDITGHRRLIVGVSYYIGNDLITPMVDRQTDLRSGTHEYQLRFEVVTRHGRYSTDARPFFRRHWVAGRLLIHTAFETAPNGGIATVDVDIH